MKSKINVMILSASLFMFFGTTSCKKNKCHECHYDKNGAEVELGEKCGDDLENLEAKGYTDATGTYTVHCHEH
jgi:hypothetical protein